MPSGAPASRTWTIRESVTSHPFATRLGYIQFPEAQAPTDPCGQIVPNGLPQVHCEDATHWNHDPAHSDGTHNDSIQVQGGKNIAIRYNTVIGSVVAGDGLGPYGTQAGSALIVRTLRSHRPA